MASHLTPKPRMPRRRFLGHLLGLAGAGLFARPASASTLTPQQAEGPFYPRSSMRRADIDNDLVKITGAVRQAGGQVVRLGGRVLDAKGNPVAGARVEIWQCDTNGNYLHPRDRGSAAHDPAFQGFGHDITDADGQYSFRTIKPVVYPGRTPHIHVKVFALGREVTTQFYTAGEAQNDRDFLFQRLSKSQQQAVLMRFGTTGKEPQARVDILV